MVELQTNFCCLRSTSRKTNSVIGNLTAGPRGQILSLWLNNLLPCKLAGEKTLGNKTIGRKRSRENTRWKANQEVRLLLKSPIIDSSLHLTLSFYQCLLIANSSYDGVNSSWAPNSGIHKKFIANSPTLPGLRFLFNEIGALFFIFFFL